MPEGANAAAIAARFRQADELHRSGELQGAAELFGEIVAVQPHHFDALHRLGIIALQTQHAGESVTWFQKAIALRADSAAVHANLCTALHLLGRFDEALDAVTRALELKPDHVEAHNNRGSVLRNLGRNAEAPACYRAALAIDPEQPDAHFNLGLSLLLQGDFAAGWDEFEWRSRVPGFPGARRDISGPRWSGGEDIRGKTILLYTEQGLGDTLQFCRYVKPLADLGAKVLLQVPRALAPLMASLQGVHRLIGEGETLPQYDCHSSLMSLPLAFGTRLESIPAEVPYLFSDPQRLQSWREKLGPRSGARVGLVCSGRTNHANDRFRSIPLAALRELTATPVKFFSLQPEIREGDAQALRACAKLTHFGKALSGFRRYRRPDRLHGPGDLRGHRAHASGRRHGQAPLAAPACQSRLALDAGAHR